jgi:small multidrug resistance family-3 protein
VPGVIVARSTVLFVLAAIAEIGGAWRSGKACANTAACSGSAPASSGSALYGFAATLQPDPNFGRILAAYGGIFVAGSLAWGVIFDGFRPDRSDATRHGELDGFRSAFRWSSH